MARTIYRERIPRSNPRLGRLVNHDSESRRYRPVTTSELKAVRHQRRIPILDQGSLGDCVANAGIGCLGTEPFYSVKLETGYGLTEVDAVNLYRVLTANDPYPGQWEPDDTGTDGLTCGKVLTAAGEIAGYLWPLGLSEALGALMITPLITGIEWLTGMFDPTSEGLVKPTGTVAGGHEVVVDEYSVERGWVGFTNSWSDSWGLGGRFYMQAEDYGTLLARNGDVTQFVPRSAPAPIPEPGPVPPDDWHAKDALDLALARQLKAWSLARHIGSNAYAARTVKTWTRLRFGDSL